MFNQVRFLRLLAMAWIPRSGYPRLFRVEMLELRKAFRDQFYSLVSECVVALCVSSTVQTVSLTSLLIP